MSKLLAAFRRLFANKGTHKEEGEHDKKDEKHVNDLQKAPPKLHPYDEVQLDNEGPTVKVEGANSTQVPNNTQEPPKRVPRPYEEVDVPAAGDGKVQVQQAS